MPEGLQVELRDPLEGIPSSGVLGTFVAFVTEDDAHSPLMIPRYQELVETFEGQIPLFFYDARRTGPAVDHLRGKAMVFSVPTLAWFRHGAVLMRQVGTVLLPKLEKEVNERIDDIIGD